MLEVDMRGPSHK